MAGVPGAVSCQTLYARLKAAPPWDDRPGGSHRAVAPMTGEAAVLSLFRRNRGRTEVFLIRRAERTGDPWSGNIAFPGGRRDAGDPDIRATVLREAEEEVGLSPGDLVGPPLLIGTRAPANRPWLHVSVFVDVLAEEGGVGPTGRNEEVAESFWAPMGELHESDAPVDVNSSIGPLKVEALTFQGRIVWGFTRRVLLDLIETYGTILSLQG